MATVCSGDDASPRKGSRSRSQRLEQPAVKARTAQAIRFLSMTKRIHATSLHAGGESIALRQRLPCANADRRATCSRVFEGGNPMQARRLAIVVSALGSVGLAASAWAGGGSNIQTDYYKDMSREELKADMKKLGAGV